jgi:hypothetical protein
LGLSHVGGIKQARMLSQMVCMEVFSPQTSRIGEAFPVMPKVLESRDFISELNVIVDENRSNQKKAFSNSYHPI